LFSPDPHYPVKQKHPFQKDCPSQEHRHNADNHGLSISILYLLYKMPENSSGSSASYVIYASYGQAARVALQDLNPPLIAVQIKEVIRQDKIVIFIPYFHALCICSCGYRYLITFKPYLKARINELKVFWRTEENRSGGNDPAFLNKLIAYIVVI
jgi:hypothetical protein